MRDLLTVASTPTRRAMILLSGAPQSASYLFLALLCEPVA